MNDSPQTLDAAFPTLTDRQIERLGAFGRCRSTQSGEVLFDQGDSTHGIFVVLEGTLEILAVSARGEAVVQVVSKGMFTGEVNQLSGRRALVRCRVAEPGRLIELTREELWAVNQRVQIAERDAHLH